MTNYNEEIEKANEARKDKNWDLALELYKKIINNYQQNNFWDKYFYSLVLYKKYMFNESLEICRNIYRENKKFSPNNSLYAQNIARLKLSNPIKISIETIIKALKAIDQLVDKQNEYIQYDIEYNKTLKLLIKNKQFNKAQMLFEASDIKKFSNKCRFIDIDRQKREIASPLEDFLVESVKIYYHFSNFEKTLETIDLAFVKIKKFHYSNHIWLKRLKAKTLVKTGKLEEATELYFKILRTKNEWFIYFELAKIIWSMKNTKAATFFLAKAIYDDQNIKYKVKLLYYIIRNNIEELNIKNTAKLLCSIYKNNKWPINSQTLFAINKAHVDCENIEKTSKYLRILKTTAKKITVGEEDKGKVFKIFNNTSGLLKTSNNEILFYVSKIGKTKITINDFVMFRSTWSYDSKKKRISESAIVYDIIEKNNK